MKPNHKKLVIGLTILFSIGLLVLIFYSTTNIKEAFQTPVKSATPAKSATPVKSVTPAKSPIPKKEPLKLSDKEQTLFNDMLSNKLTDVNIQSLIQSGFLTENMIEKFLTKIQGDTTVPSALELNSAVPPDEAAIAIVKKASASNIPKLEGFTTNAPIYAQYY